MKQSPVRQNIIETASALFYSNGYNATGINEIIAEAGIAKATLYNHFKSKEAICIAYLQHKNKSFFTDITAFCLTKVKGKNRVLAIFDFLQLFFKDKDFNGCWCIKTIAEIPHENVVIREEIQNQKKSLIVFIEGLLEENMEIKSKKKNTVLSRQLYLLYESAVAESHLHQQDWPIKEAKQLAKIIMV